MVTRNIKSALTNQIFKQEMLHTYEQKCQSRDELVREAEISGRVGSETTARQRTLEEKTGIHPAVSWSGTGKIQLNEEVTVTLTLQKDLGLFGKLRSFPVTIRARASGKSEVYWK